MTLHRADDGLIDLPAFAHHLQFLQRSGLRGFVLNGATGEFCLTSVEELGQMLTVAREVVGAGSTLIAAIGGASTTQVVQRLRIAAAAGADALLLPMPYFFPYAQQDLSAFVGSIAAQATLPLLLYNLPSFTTPLEPATTLELLSAAVAGRASIAGIKDSSGSLDTLRLLKAQLPSANRIIGNDRALHDAIAEGLCDGVVSGVACVLPEFMQAFYQAASLDPMSEQTRSMKRHLDDFTGWLGRFPVPWGLKSIAAERGLSPLDLPLPAAPQRVRDHQLYMEWFRANKRELMATALV